MSTTSRVATPGPRAHSTSGSGINQWTMGILRAVRTSAFKAASFKLFGAQRLIQGDRPLRNPVRQGGAFMRT